MSGKIVKNNIITINYIYNKNSIKLKRKRLQEINLRNLQELQNYISK